MALDVELDRVSMRFGDTVVLSEVSIAVAAGEAVSFVGPRGCGKTTILRLIAGLNEPTEGQIRIGGREMAGVRPTDRPTGLILHSLPVYPLMRVWENVVFHLDAPALDRRGRRALAESLLERFALAGQADQALIELDALDRLRVAIAGVLATEPAVLLLDEPLAALPPGLADPLLADLVALHGRQPLTLVYITGDAAAAERLGGQVAHMQAGRIDRIERAAGG